MKVLLVSGSFPPMRCGVGDYTGSLATALAQHAGASVTVLTSKAEGLATAEGGVEVVRAMQSWHASALAPFHAALQRVQPDVVHIQFPTQGYDTWSGLAAIAFQARLKHRLAVVATLHEFFPRTVFRSDRWIYALALLAHRIVVVRPNYYPTIPRAVRLFIPSSKVRFIGNASAVPTVELTDAERRTVREELRAGERRLVAFFGFSFHHKGVDHLFRIADPARDHLLLIGHLSADEAYHAQIRELSDSERWKGKVTITGFVEPARAARLLAAADAAVFPYRVGGGIWNSSLHAAASQGTFAITTATDRNGYDAGSNIYYARTDDIDEMRKALARYLGTRRPAASGDAWAPIARAHAELYGSICGKAART